MVLVKNLNGVNVKGMIREYDMKPVFMTKFGGSEAPNEEQGNCMAACLASMFEIDIEDVPDFGGTITNGKWYVILSAWLAKRNLELSFYPAKGTVSPMQGYYMLAVKSTTLKNPDDGHMVVAKNGQVVHDPNPNATSIGEHEQLWLLTPIDLSLCKEFTNEM